MKDLEKLSKSELIAEIRELRKMQQLAVEKVKEKTTTENKLKESEEKFKALYDNAPLSYQSLNEDGSFKDINPTWLSTLGYERDEVIGKFYKDFLHPNWQPHFEINFPKFKKRGYVNDVQFKIRHKAGHYIDISFEGCIGYHPDGSFKQTYCVFKDITEQKKAEEKLIESENFLDNIINNIGDPFFVKDDQSKIILANDAFCNLFNLDRDQMIGKTLAEEVPLEEQESFLSIDKEVIETGKENINEESFSVIGKQTKIFSTKKSRYIDENGTKLLIGTIRDITEQKQAEEKVKESEERLKKVFNTSPFPIAVVDVNDDAIHFWSQSALIMFGHNPVSAGEWYELAYPDPVYRQEVLEQWKPLLKEAEQSKTAVNTGEYNIVCKDGSIKICEMYAQFIPGNLIVTMHDITERKLAEEALTINENRLQNVFEKMSEGFSIQDVICDDAGNPIDLRFVDANQAFETQTGLINSETLGHTLLELFPTSEKLWIEKYGHVGITGEPLTFEAEFGPLNKFYHVNAFQIKDRQFATLFTDINERKLHEIEIANSNKRYESLFNNSPIPLWEEDFTVLDSYLNEIKDKGHKDLRTYFENNPDELLKCAGLIKILDVNQAAVDLHKAKSKEQLIGNLSKTFSENSFTVLKDEILALAEGKELYESEAEVKSLEGDLINIYITLKIDRSQPGKVRALLATSDITERKQADKKIRTAEKTLQNTFDLSPSIISKADMNIGRFIQVNKAITKILGYTVEEFTSKPYMEFIHPDDRQRTIDEATEQLKGREVTFFENRYLCKDGSYKWMAWHGTKLDENGIATAIGSDIHERKQAEQELKKHREHLEDLVKERTNELEIKNIELERFNELFVDREFRIKELRDEINELKTGK